MLNLPNLNFASPLLKYNEDLQILSARIQILTNINYIFPEFCIFYVLYTI